MKILRKTKLNLTEKWDKVFSLNEKVNHMKVTYVNRYEIRFSPNLYIPKKGKEDKLQVLAVGKAYMEE